MCGIFGYFGKPDLMTIFALALETSRRGPHAFGWASAFGTHKQVGNLENYATAIPEADWCIGHSRLSTSGDYRKPENNQPLTVGDRCLVHNGNIYAYREIYQRLRYHPVTENDSEALIALSLYDPDWKRIVMQDIALTSPIAAILRTPEETYIIRSGHPLYRADIAGCTYFCSRSFHSDCRLVESGITHLCQGTWA